MVSEQEQDLEKVVRKYLADLFEQRVPTMDPERKQFFVDMTYNYVVDESVNYLYAALEADPIGRTLKVEPPTDSFFEDAWSNLDRAIHSARVYRSVKLHEINFPVWRKDLDANALFKESALLLEDGLFPTVSLQLAGRGRDQRIEFVDGDKNVVAIAKEARDQSWVIRKAKEFFSAGNER